MVQIKFGIKQTECWKKPTILLKTTSNNYQVEVINVSGQKLITLYNPKTINFSAYSKGIYFIKIIDNNGKCVVSKIIKE